MRPSLTRHLGQLTHERARAMAAALPSAQGGVAPPLPAPEFDRLDYVGYLLAVDAEVEHGLMIQYLYAAYSLGGPQVPAEYRVKVRGWQEVILGIAKEEMAHLITVQNVLRLIGAPLNLGRDDYPWDTPFYPFPFALEPLTLDSLAKYVFAESPADWSGAEADEIRARVHQATPTPHQVGVLLGQVIDLLANPHFLPDDVFQAATWPYQAKWDEWGRGYRGGARGDTGGANPPGSPNLLVIAAASRDDAVAAIKAIAEQGEACPTADPANPSHFARFLKIYREMKALFPAGQKAGWQPARNVATNPFIPPSDRDDPAEDLTALGPRDPITHPEAVLWAHLFNVRYRMVLNYLAHSFELAGGLSADGARTPRGLVVNSTFGEMYNLRAIADVLVQTPLSRRPGDHKTAGPPFQMPYTLTLPSGEQNRWRLHQSLLRAAAPLVNALLAVGSDSRHDYLYSLREADKGLGAVIDRILAARTGASLS